MSRVSCDVLFCAAVSHHLGTKVGTGQQRLVAKCSEHRVSSFLVKVPGRFLGNKRWDNLCSQTQLTSPQNQPVLRGCLSTGDFEQPARDTHRKSQRVVVKPLGSCTGIPGIRLFHPPGSPRPGRSCCCPRPSLNREQDFTLVLIMGHIISQKY